jgi:hypothetical protein
MFATADTVPKHASNDRELIQSLLYSSSQSSTSLSPTYPAKSRSPLERGSLLVPTNPPKYDTHGKLLSKSHDRPESCLPQSRSRTPYNSGHRSPGVLSTYECDAKLPYFEQQDIFDITCQGRPVVPVIDATITGGFFLSDGVWTTCQINCFAVSASFGVKDQALEPLTTGAFQVSKDVSNQMPIVAFGLTLSAERCNGNPLELIQHTVAGYDSSLLHQMPASIFTCGLQTNSVTASPNTTAWKRVQIMPKKLLE